MVFPAPGVLAAAGVSVGPYVTTGNDYDGTNDFARRGDDLTGSVDGKAGFFSFWFNLNGGDANRQTFFGTNGDRVDVERLANDKFQVTCKNASATTILLLTSISTYTASGGWVHITASWNLATTTANLFINDVDDLAGGATITDDTIEYTTNNWSIGATTGTIRKIDACLSEFIFDQIDFDISNTANRRKLITAGGQAC